MSLQMRMKNSDAHNLLRKSVSEDDLVLAIHYNLIQQEIFTAFNNAATDDENDTARNGAIALPQRNLDVVIRLNKTGLGLKVTSNLTFQLNGTVSVMFVARDTRERVRERIITFNETPLFIKADPMAASGLRIEADVSESVIFEAPNSEPRLSGLTALGIDSSRYAIIEEAIMIRAADNIATRIVGHIHLPPFRRLLAGVDFENMLLLASVGEYLVLSGRGIVTASGPCAYVPSTSIVNETGIVTTAPVCGADLVTEIGEIIVDYPRKIIQEFVEFREKIGIAAVDRGDRSDTIHFMDWDVTVALKKATITLDTVQATLGLKVELEPSGSGSAGPIIGFGSCSMHVDLVRARVNSLARIESELIVRPCLDFSRLYLDFVWQTAPDIKMELTSGIPPLGLLLAFLKSSVSQKLSKDIQTKISGSMRFPLVDVNALLSFRPNGRAEGKYGMRITGIGQHANEISYMLTFGFTGLD